MSNLIGVFGDLYNEMQKCGVRDQLTLVMSLNDADRMLWQLKKGIPGFYEQTSVAQGAIRIGNIKILLRENI